MNCILANFRWSHSICIYIWDSSFLLTRPMGQCSLKTLIYEVILNRNSFFFHQRVMWVLYYSRIVLRGRQLHYRSLYQIFTKQLFSLLWSSDLCKSDRFQIITIITTFQFDLRITRQFVCFDINNQMWTDKFKCYFSG